MNKWRYKSGFSLVEMIISVAVLAIMSIYLLKLFGTAQRMNEQAFELDGATNCLKSRLTLLRNEGDRISNFSEFVGKDEKNNSIYSIHEFLDASFKTVEKSEGIYSLIINFNKEQTIPNGEGLFLVEAGIWRLESVEDSEFLAELKTYMLFLDDGGE